MIRFGIVGTNWITEEFIQSASHLPDFQLTAVYSRTEEKGRQFADKYDVKHVFTNLEEMAKSDCLDAVYIASPTSFHAEQSIVFLQNNKHVLCEKPLASNPQEVEAMIATAKKHQVLLMEAMKTTFLPSFKAIQKHIHKIGKVRMYFSSYCKYSSRYDAYREGNILNAFNPIFSNGSLMDLGVYCIYPLVLLFGEPKSIKANGVMLESGVDGNGMVLLKYDDFEAVVVHSKISTSYLPIEIQGEEGTMIIQNPSTPGKLEIRYRNGELEKINEETEHPSMYYEVEEFLRLIQAGKRESMINSYDHSLITARILAEARKQIGLVYPADHKV
ncbi:Gfo/Idh/MocA family oxidoreductase [Bacillus sp. FJAT-50079]|uniref:Gfo/Idh/MocA family protein n=1 Tax=Bacillus sp. FJAT-50079 TaxID=2833577 RepID=UPI001BC8FA71|nr:Gfo/Idh/MocA family oxidoreductase [Bacillus sp. FJAT-50079]MBS4209307.1 Gfo/Idh/MocA family oxidoreductase [Bacillus sp. FJAT-50079]